MLRRALLAGIVALAAMAAASVQVMPVYAQGGGEETEELSNNLSSPVIWSDGAALTLPGEFGKPELTNPATWTIAGEPTQVYEQATEGNVWQAQNEVALTPVEVSEIDWGDNLEAKSLSLGKPVRVETTLLKNLETPMLAFQMVSNELEKKEEKFATTGQEEDSTQALIYSGCARLTIQRLLISREDPYITQLKWDSANGEWTGSGLIAPPVFNGGVWESTGENTGYSAELNASGKVVYGYNWRTSGLEAGDYRLTFSLNPACPAATLNTYITSATKVSFTEEEESTAAAPAADEGTSGASGGGAPQVDAVNNLSYVDVQLGNPSYEPYVPPAPEEPESKQETTTTTTTTSTPITTVTTTVTSQTRSQTKEQTHKRLHMHIELRKKLLLHKRNQVVYQLSGTASPPRNQQQLRIQIRTKHGWRTVATVRLQRDTKTRSRFRIRLRNPRSGIYRAMLAGNGNYFLGVSPALRIRVS